MFSHYTGSNFIADTMAHGVAANEVCGRRTFTCLKRINKSDFIMGNGREELCVLQLIGCLNQDRASMLIQVNMISHLHKTHG